MINYIFSTHLRLSNGKRLSETARNKALCQWLFIRLLWSAHASLWLRSQQFNRKRPWVLSAIAEWICWRIHHKLDRLCACFINQFFWSNTCEGHHLLYWKTACGKLGCDGCHSISWSGNGCGCSCGAGNEAISAACRHLPWDSSSRGLQQYILCQHDIFVSYNYTYEDGKYAVSGSLRIIHNYLMCVLQRGS